MDQYTTTRLDTTLNEFVALWEVLEEVLVFNIIYFNGLVDESVEQALLHRGLKD